MNGITHDDKSEKATTINDVSVHPASNLEHGEYPAVHLLTEQENRRIRWKIGKKLRIIFLRAGPLILVCLDLIVLPCIVISMTLAFLDKVGRIVIVDL